MGAAKFQTAKQLMDRYSSAQERERVLHLYQLSEFLGECVIRENYRVPDELNNAIKLTEYGAWLVKRSGQAKVPPKIARLTCLLELFSLEMLVDPVETDIDAVASAIANEITSGRILLPFIFGPGLYLEAANLFEDRMRTLPIADVLRLLKGKPQGVFHYGPWLSGPWGLFRTSHTRMLAPTRRVPLQHCHDVSCRVVHATHLQTDAKADINRHRSTVVEIIRDESDRASEFGVFLSELLRDSRSSFDDQDYSAFPYLLGDGFSSSELRFTIAHLLESDRKFVEELECAGLLDRVKAHLQEDPEDDDHDALSDHAVLVMICLFATDEQLRTAIDELLLEDVAQPVIEIPAGEVRRSVLTHASSTEFRNRPEVSNLGCRVDSVGVLGPLRLRRLIDELFGVPRAEDMHALESNRELEWHLRSVSGVSVAARLDEYLRTSPPDEVLQRLVMSSKERVDAAFKHVGLELKRADDDTQVLRLLWKLGFDVSSERPLHDRFWHLHERMTHSAKNANVSTLVDQEAVRGLGANFFVALENLLHDTIAFVAWAMTNDHVLDERPFTYPGAGSAAAALGHVRQQLQELGARADAKPEKWTLYPLVLSFRALASLLRRHRANGHDFVRPGEQHPEFAGRTSLEQFPFAHAIPFLDLSGQSQEDVLATLEAVSDELVTSRVHEVRNENLHHRQGENSYKKLLNALTLTASAIRRLEEAGFIRTLYSRDRLEGDRWGRTTHYLRSRSGREVGFRRPASYSWLGMPSLRANQYVMHAARFAEPSEMLRFKVHEDSEFRRLWEGVPHRTRRAIDLSTEEPDIRTSQFETDARAGSGTSGLGPN